MVFQLPKQKTPQIVSHRFMWIISIQLFSSFIIVTLLYYCVIIYSCQFFYNPIILILFNSTFISGLFNIPYMLTSYYYVINLCNCDVPLSRRANNRVSTLEGAMTRCGCAASSHAHVAALNWTGWSYVYTCSLETWTSVLFLMVFTYFNEKVCFEIPFEQMKWKEKIEDIV